MQNSKTIVTRRYEELCGGLEQLMNEFLTFHRRGRRVNHRFIYGALSSKPWSQEIWKNMKKAKANLLDPAALHKWSVYPDLSGCSLITWYGNKADFNEFKRLAATGGDLLNELRSLDELPHGAKLLQRYPKGGTEIKSSYMYWLRYVHDTGISCPTTKLQVDLGNWAKSSDENQGPVDQISEVLTTINGNTFPAHPFVESLRYDVFKSSAEAIRIWLNPDAQEIVQLDRWDDDLPIVLPFHIQNHVQSVSCHEQSAPEPVPEMQPRWDQIARELYVGDLLIKQFCKAAKHQELVIHAFENQGWPKRIVKPLPEIKGKVYRDRLSETVWSLNKLHHTPNVLYFEMDGTGLGIKWSIIDPTGDAPQRRRHF